MPAMAAPAAAEAFWQPEQAAQAETVGQARLEAMAEKAAK
jgi:hypothetical protein